MEAGLIILILIVAIVILYFFNYHILMWAILLGIAGFIFAIIREFLETEGKLKDIARFFKNIGKWYLKTEAKFFNWIDSL